MSLNAIISAKLTYFSNLSKTHLLDIIEHLKSAYLLLEKKFQSLEKENKALRSEVALLKKAQLSEQVKKVNEQSNKPSSKQADWELKGVGNDGQGKRKGRGKKGRKGAGNKPKTKPVTQRETACVAECFNCGKDLSEKPVLKSSNTRQFEDIKPVETSVVEVVQQKSYCTNCKKVITARSDKALPGADIGLQTSIQLIYQWVALCLPTTRIALFLQDIFGLKLSTAGISAHLIKVADILKVVQEDILTQLKDGSLIHADETGWRVNGDLWWMWVVGNKKWAYYLIDKSRGKDVVRKILGEVFLGILVVDGWKAYLSVECEQQSCMAHLLRKIRKLYAAFPKLSSVFRFYIAFRKILRDGEQLQSKREVLSQVCFEKRLQKLHKRLDKLLAWRNPNDILKQVIKKVKNQRDRTLTFVEHPGVPCHNNFGEYLIRIGVLKRKVSFGSKSAKGAEAYAILLSIYTTCKLQGISFKDYLEKSLKHYTQTGKPLLINQYLQLNNLQQKQAA